LIGVIDLAKPVVFGPVEFWEQDGRLRFKVSFDVAGKTVEEIETLLVRLGGAVEAAVAAATGAAVEAHVSGSSYPYPDSDLRRVTSSLHTSWNVRVGLDAGAKAAAEAAFGAVVDGTDPRLPELYVVYLLGIRAVQTIAPVVGLWAFSTVLEEANPRKKRDLAHVKELADDLRSDGYHVPANPTRNPNTIRGAALHSTPEKPMPTAEEVAWFRAVTHAYLLHRATVSSDGTPP